MFCEVSVTSDHQIIISSFSSEVRVYSKLEEIPARYSLDICFYKNGTNRLMDWKDNDEDDDEDNASRIGNRQCGGIKIHTNIQDTIDQTAGHSIKD